MHFRTHNLKAHIGVSGTNWHKRVRRDRTLCETSSALSLRWLYPWEERDYPGHRLGCLSLFGHTIGWEAVLMWRRRSTPLWALLILRDAMAARLESGQAILAFIDRDIAAIRANPPKTPGFAKQGIDGRDHRPRSGFIRRGRPKQPQNVPQDVV